MNSAKNFYDLAIEGGQSGITSITDLDGKHINFKNQALAKFDTQPKIGSKDVATTYRTKLGENIETHYAPIRAKWEANFNRPPPSPPRSDSPDILKEIGDAITAPFQSLNNSIRDVFGW